MQVRGQITIAEVEEGKSRSTGNDYKKQFCILAYPGKYANGSDCTRTLAFTIFGQNRIDQLNICEGQVGVLDIDFKGSIQTSPRTGNKYTTLDTDVLDWKVDTARSPQEVTSQPKLQPVAQAQPVAQPSAPAYVKENGKWRQLTPEEKSDLPF